MKQILALITLFIAFSACQQPNATTAKTRNSSFDSLLDNYYEERLKLYPLEGTSVGDNRYNDTLVNDGSAEFVSKITTLYSNYLAKLQSVNRDELNDEDQLSYDILSYQLNTMLEGLQLKIFYDYANFAHPIYTPFNQMVSVPLMMAQMASGTGSQPFKTVEDYEKWLKRLGDFKTWADTAIANMNAGIAAGVVLPRSIVAKIIPQMNSMDVASPEKSIFYEPIKNFPQSFSDSDRNRLTVAFRKVIGDTVEPTYKRLGNYLQKEYLPKARSSSGMGGVQNGTTLYNYMVRQNTTTNKTPEEVYQIGLSEVARIRGQMDSIRNAVGFKGDLKAFFEFMKTDKQFMPYSEPKQILDAFEKIHTTMEPQLKKLFNHVPKTRFEIRQTESFRAASASAEYLPGSADGTRPGVFYVPILNAKDYNTTSGMESLFLHEAIPGHHYQISLTQENTSLPKFRRFANDNAYVEGWALYCESLGKELGLYTDPYQYMGALGDEIHRAIRLVVDVAIHAKGMTREQAIKYMMDNEAISEQGATAEIERYMSNPGQALGYKIGALKIRELRDMAEKKLGDKFNVAEFHNQILKDGSMPLSILENKIKTWVAGRK